MPISSVNFGRWLERLGFKHLEQPPIHQNVTPVAIAQDQRQLVSLALGPSGIVGAVLPAVVGEWAAIQFLGTSPAEIGIMLGFVGSGDFAVEIGPSGSPRPVMTAPTVLVRQEFQPGGDNIAQRGSFLAAPPADTPSIRVPTSVGTFNRLIKPPGGWLQITARTVGASFHVAAWVYEHPTENAQ